MPGTVAAIPVTWSATPAGSVMASSPRPYSPARTTPGTATSSSSSAGVRPEITATIARRSTSRAIASRAPSRILASSGLATMGLRVPSKSSSTPARPSRVVNARRAASSSVARIVIAPMHA